MPVFLNGFEAAQAITVTTTLISPLLRCIYRWQTCHSHGGDTGHPVVHLDLSPGVRGQRDLAQVFAGERRECH